MLTLFTGGKVFINGTFAETDIFVCNQKIEKIGPLDKGQLSMLPFDVKIVECRGSLVLPGFVDPHCHVSGGSGEGGGFSTQSMPILASEFVRGGITTVVGTLGVDTTTKTMPDLLAKIKAHNEIGLTAFCYTGGYDVPPKTITGNVRDDIMFIDEVIGVGEISIADHRAPEPELGALARTSIDAYVGGMLSGKAGVTHFHVGAADRRLSTARKLLETQSIDPAKLYFTHVERSKALVEEAIAMAKRGAFVDFDIHERDLYQWYSVFRDLNGPQSQLSVSSDGGVSSPTEIWAEFRSCALEHKVSLPELIPLFSVNAARALGLKNKGVLGAGRDADIIVASEKELELTHLMAKGQFLLESGTLTLQNHAPHNRRGFDIYEIHQG